MREYQDIQEFDQYTQERAEAYRKDRDALINKLNSDFERFCNSFPTGADIINEMLSEAAQLDACVYEVRRRINKPERFEYVVPVAERILAARQMNDFDNAQTVTRFTL